MKYGVTGMQAKAGFLGEIEFVDAALPDGDFGLFEQLPNVEQVHGLAHEFSETLELMPYQKVGEPAKLLVSVYMESRQAQGRIIAVLVRERYPENWQALAEMVRLARQRVDTLARLKQQFMPGSIEAARQALDRLHEKIQRM